MNLTPALNQTGLYLKLYNGTKTILIPPMLISNKLTSNFTKKPSYFNLPQFSFKDQNILKIIHSISINKAHGYDDIPVR